MTPSSPGAGPWPSPLRRAPGACPAPPAAPAPRRAPRHPRSGPADTGDAQRPPGVVVPWAAGARPHGSCSPARGRWGMSFRRRSPGRRAEEPKLHFPAGSAAGPGSGPGRLRPQGHGGSGAGVSGAAGPGLGPSRVLGPGQIGGVGPRRDLGAGPGWVTGAGPRPGPGRRARRAPLDAGWARGAGSGRGCQIPVGAGAELLQPGPRAGLARGWQRPGDRGSGVSLPWGQGCWVIPAPGPTQPHPSAHTLTLQACCPSLEPWTRRPSLLGSCCVWVPALPSPASSTICTGRKPELRHRYR